jgi:protein-tyrosine phosphatase
VRPELDDTAPTTTPRVRVADGCHNLRDLGGLVTVDGRRVRRGRLFRSDYPGFAEVDERAAAELALATVVDLRRGTEAAVECVDWAARGVAHRRWPLTAGREQLWHARYPAYLSRRPETVVGAVREAMRPEGHPVLVHCAAGKDRTGVIVALLLSVLGVREDDIVEDYMLSAASVEPVLVRLLAMDLYSDMLADSGVEDQRPRAEYLRSLLGWVEEKGGAEEWLMRNGAPEEEITAFRGAVLEG